MFNAPELTSKSVVYKNKHSDTLEYVDNTIPLVKKGEGYGVKDDQVLVKIAVAAFNPVDAILKQFAYPIFNWFYPNFGLCHDYSGEVVDIGSTAQAKLGFKVGDKVCGQTGAGQYKYTLTEYVNFELSKSSLWSMIKVPSTLTMEEAGSFSLVYSTAAIVVENAIIGDAGRVLVNGGSTSVGSYVISLLKLDPKVKEIVATCSKKSENKVKSLGADEIIDYTATSNITNSVLEYCKDSKFDSYLDCTGNDQLLKNCSQFVVQGGATVLVSGGKKQYLSEKKTGLGLVTFDWIKLAVLSKLGLHPVKIRSVVVKPGGGFENVVELFESGKIKPFVDSVYPFDQAQKAHDLVVSCKNNGKVVVRVSD